MFRASRWNVPELQRSSEQIRDESIKSRELCSRNRYITHFYCLAVEAGFYSDVVECLPLDPAAQVRFPPRAVGIFLHPVTKTLTDFRAKDFQDFRGRIKNTNMTPYDQTNKMGVPREDSSNTDSSLRAQLNRMGNNESIFLHADTESK